MAGAGITAGKAQRVGVDELSFVQRNRRTVGIRQPRVDSQRRSLAFPPQRDRLLDRQVPGVIQVEVGPVAGKQRRVGETGTVVLRSVARDRQRLGDGVFDGRAREVGRACVPASRADVDGYADALVPIVGDGLHLALAHRHAQAECL